METIKTLVINLNPEPISQIVKEEIEGEEVNVLVQAPQDIVAELVESNFTNKDKADLEQRIENALFMQQKLELENELSALRAEITPERLAAAVLGEGSDWLKSQTEKINNIKNQLTQSLQ